MALRLRQFFSRHYAELKDKARKQSAREFSDPSSAESILHGLWIDMAQQEGTARTFPTAELLGRIAPRLARLGIERARARRARKRNGGIRPDDLTQEPASPGASPSAEIDLRQLIGALAAEYPRTAAVVELVHVQRYTRPEAAEKLAITLSAVDRNLAFAASWLARHVKEGERASPSPARVQR